MGLPKLQPPHGGLKYDGIRIDEGGFAEVSPGDMPSMMKEGWTTYPEAIEIIEPPEIERDEDDG